MGRKMTSTDKRQGLLEGQVRILKLIANDNPVEDTLVALTGMVEELEPGAVAGVTIVDRAERSLEMAVFPSVPRIFADSIAGVPLGPPHVGTCAQALYRGTVVTSENLSNDGRFAKEWIDLCLANGIQSCRSQPVRDARGAPLGTFMLCFREPRKLDSFDETLMETVAELVGFALERRRSQIRQELMVGELNHRARNVFSTIGALAYFTLQHNPDAAGFRKAFDGRLGALANSHSLLLMERGADLRAVVRQVLDPYGSDRVIEMTGPPIRLAPDAATALSMATHELTTNAAKYGALSSPGGKLSITWDIKTAPGEGDAFTLNWTETGGPEVHLPTRRGFGIQAIERLLAQEIDGKAIVAFAPEGLRCSIEAPFTEKLGPRV
jgi:two-component sensor histidine kinase